MAQKAINMIGQKFNKLTVIARDINPPNTRNSWWICECKCGNIKSYPRPWLLKGEIKSCGCSQHLGTHGMYNTPEYQTWKDMIGRCYNPNRPGYKNYGQRGITICDRWRYSFQSFIDDMGLKPFDGATIERDNNDGNYEPTNCKWATREEQNRNRRSVLIKDKNQADQIRQEYSTGKYTQLQLANIHGVNEHIIWHIVNNDTWT